MEMCLAGVGACRVSYMGERMTVHISARQQNFVTSCCSHITSCCHSLEITYLSGRRQRDKPLHREQITVRQDRACSTGTWSRPCDRLDRRARVCVCVFIKTQVGTVCSHKYNRLCLLHLPCGNFASWHGIKLIYKHTQTKQKDC